MNPSIDQAQKKLWEYLHASEYKGWDPFDGLNSQIFRSTPLNRSRLCRLAWLQFFKRCPVNLRALARVPKGENAKGLALLSSAALLRGEAPLADTLLAKLENMRSPARDNWCWGYNFDWQARAFYVPMGTPNMVTSVFVANAYLDRYDKTQQASDLEKAEGVCNFILDELVLHEEQEEACFGYIPGESARVHNANMLGAALMARTGAINGSKRLMQISEKSIRYSVNAMQANGAWPYGERSHHGFVDNFHTGYNLVCLQSWMQHSEKDLWQKELKLALRYFVDSFWLPDGTPKYYDTSTYPIDTHCSAMGLVTCAKLRDDMEDDLLAERIATWAIDNLQRDNGAFAYQIHPHYKNSIPYMRWTQCWMAYGFAHLT